jgi:hypothetical protein
MAAKRVNNFFHRTKQTLLLRDHARLPDRGPNRSTIDCRVSKRRSKSGRCPIGIIPLSHPKMWHSFFDQAKRPEHSTMALIQYHTQNGHQKSPKKTTQIHNVTGKWQTERSQPCYR